LATHVKDAGRRLSLPIESVDVANVRAKHQEEHADVSGPLCLLKMEKMY
jgi:hypothetical protein